MRFPQLFVAVAVMVLSTLTAGAAPKTPHRQVADPYAAELARQCPERGLRDLAPSDLGALMQGFTARLPPDQRHVVEDAVGERCARVEAGLTCANAASIAAFRRLGVLKAFVSAVCAAGLKPNLPAQGE
jgi:hypothetical protein